MNVRWLFFVSLLLITQASAAAQDDGSILVNNAIKAIEQGNSRQLSIFFGNNVELSVPRAEGTFSKPQAEIIFRSFFAANKPKSFELLIQNVSRDGTVYVIGVLHMLEGQSFRCYLVVRKVSGSYRLHQIQIEQ